MAENNKSIREEIKPLLDKEQWQDAAGLLKEAHPADIADLITSYSSEAREQIFSCLEKELQADVLAELEGSAEDDVLESLSNLEISDLVEDMAPDDAADVIAELDDERSEKVLELMELHESEEVRELLKYDEESAGGIMTSDVFSLRHDMTVEEALDAIRHSELDEAIYYVYVIGAQGKLVGSIELWDLLHVKNEKQMVGDIADHDIHSVPATLDQEEVANAISKYDLAAIPVVSDEGILLGRITVDDVIDVIEEEASEDILKMAGSDDVELEQTSAMVAFRTRLPWLLVTMLITFASSFILKKFLDFKEVLALSLFVPIVMAMCGSTGMQSSTLIIRSLALKTLEGVSIFKLLGKEILAGGMMGVVCGAILGGWARFVTTFHPMATDTAVSGTIIFPPIFLAITAGVALLCSMTFAAVFGASIPILLNRIKIDPAVASGPFVTASNDVLALLIYYGITVLFVGLHTMMVAT